MSTIYVNTEELLSRIANKYVCWIDLMGTESIMGFSLVRAANYICRLHVAIIESTNLEDNSIELYPMIDGMYVTASDKTVMLNFLNNVFLKLAYEFVEESNLQHKFLPRAAISYGPIVDGKDISKNVNASLHDNEKIKNSLLFGIPVIAAHKGERLAPPFGVFVDQSARMFAPDKAIPLPYVWYKWPDNKESPVHSKLTEVLNKYFDWCISNHYTLSYSVDRIKEHRAMANEYFSFIKE